MTEPLEMTFTVPDEHFGERLDQVVAQLCPQFSRSQLQKWIKSGDVLVDGKPARTRDKLKGGESLVVTPLLSEQMTDKPESIHLDIVFEDEQLLVINKPAGLVVHPGAGNQTGTLVNALLAHNDKQKTLPRAGIVHRLDKDTTGLMMVAKTLEAHTALVSQLQAREVKREYLALVAGDVIAGASIEGNIGRHPRDRKRMAVLANNAGRPAITHYRIERRLNHHTLLRVTLETGRTHQIRVHLSSRQMPIVGDRVYGGRSRIPAKMESETRNVLQAQNTQMLHATRLTLAHPLSGKIVSFTAPMPQKMQALVALLEKD